MNIPILVVLKDFISFCEENNITEPTKKDIEKYVASCHYDFVDDLDSNTYDVDYYEKELEKVLCNIFQNIIGIPRKEKETKQYFQYELIAIFTENTENPIKIISKMLQENNAIITKVEEWGNKKLAYPIKKENVLYNKGFYILYNFKANPNIAEKLGQEIGNNNNILKHIIIDITDK